MILKMGKTFKKETGITLMALSITIIVLLILAGVGIGAITGEKSIIKNAEEGTQNVEKRNIIEKIRADIYTEETVKNRELKPSEYIDIFNKYAENIIYEGSNIKSITTKQGNYTIEISEILLGKDSISVDENT